MSVEQHKDLKIFKSTEHMMSQNGCMKTPKYHSVSFVLLLWLLNTLDQFLIDK